MGQPTNQELVEKAVVETTALASAGGLNPMQTEKFLDYVVDETSMKGHIRMVRVRGKSWEINKINVGRRVAMAAEEGRDPRMRQGVTTDKVTLTPVEIIVPFSVTDSFKEENIELENINDHIIRMMATKAANDTEEMAINGDSVGASILESDYLPSGGSSTQYRLDNFLKLQDGWWRSIDTGGHLFDADNEQIGTPVFGGAIRALPEKWRRQRKTLRWFGSPDVDQLWRERLSGRATQLGDSALSGDNTQKPFGIPLVPVPLLPFQMRIVQHITLVGVVASALRYKNISDVIVTRSTLGSTAETPYILTTDYVLDTSAGTITRAPAGAITDPQTVKVTYNTNPQMLLTHEGNLIMAIGREVRLEKARDIYARSDDFVLTLKAAVGVEETDACVKVHNIALTV